MVTSKIKNLSEEDLDYLDKLLHVEVEKEHNASIVLKINRIIDAIQSQKNLLTMPKW